MNFPSMSALEGGANVANLRSAVQSGAFTNPPDELVRALNASDAVADLRAELVPTAVTAAQLIEQAQTALLAGEPVDMAAFSESAVAAFLDAERLDAGARALDRLDINLHAQVQATIKRHSDTLLADLHAQLEPLVQALRGAVTAMGGLDLDTVAPEELASAAPKVRDAVGVIGAGLKEYRKIRRLQRMVLTAHAEEAGSWVTGSGTRVMRWSEAWATGLLEVADPGAGGLDLPEGERGHDLALIARDDIWVPTRPEALAAWSRLTQAPASEPKSINTRAAAGKLGNGQRLHISL